MHSEQFRPLLTSHGPYGSVYFDDSHDTEDANIQIELKWRGLRTELERQGAGAELIHRLQDAVTAVRPAVGRGGRVVVANADQVLVDEHLSEGEGASQAQFSGLPYIVPALASGRERPSYLVVTVDHAGADIEIHRDPGDRETITVDGGGYPVHKAGRADTPGYGDPQPHTEENRSKNIRSVAERVATLVDDEAPAIVFLVGEVRSRNDLAAALPQRVTDLLVHLHVGARRSGFDRRDLDEAIEARLAQRQHDATEAVLQRFSAELSRHSGLATEGLPGVCAALRDGAVETLILGDIGDATVVSADDLTTVAPNENVLSELGAAPSHVLRADEALPMAAISIGADLIGMPEGYSAADGVGAVLRYAPRQPAGVT
ncbi:Rv2629 family ribosome hibernation factor [Mycolicibacterium houstonense]|uniref:Rv2629 family ribosome hibernation factor n=1 Tax=Mycolicibacterium houstonense TaxID=146021 RepID=UPI003F97D013